VVVAGGVESMSRVTMGADGGAIWDPSMAFELGTVPQGISADLLATLHGISRKQADVFAAESQRRAAHAQAEGYFKRSLVPVLDRSGRVVLAEDEYLRPDTTAESLAKLKASFEQMGREYGLDALTRRRYPQIEHIDHIHHAGNASGIVDGAAAVLVGNKAAGEKLALKPRARIRSFASVGDDPVIMLSATVPASQRALAKAGLKASDLDLVEINEAFAAVALYTMAGLGLDPAKVNVNGGAIALGHPLGATGAMLMGTLLDELERRDATLGLVTLCIGGGMGIATIIERI
jgi:acetyl-CoA C-acetyltransferase